MIFFWLLRKSTLPQKKLDDLDDALLDDEIKPKHKPIQRRVSTVSIGSGRPPNSSGSQKSFNPRQDPNMLVTIQIYFIQYLYVNVWLFISLFIS